MNKNSYWITVSSRGFDENNLLKLIEYNPDGIRINTGRDSYEWAMKTIDFLANNSYPISKIYLDIANNKPRIVLINDTEYFFKKGSTIKIGIDDDEDVDAKVSTKTFISNLSKNDIILFGDGEIKCVVEAILNNSAILKSLRSGSITNMTAISIENKNYSKFYVEPSEYQIIQNIISKYKISLIISFVESVNDVIWAENNFINANVIMPKIETLSAINNIDEILIHSSSVLLGRGDLSLSIGIEKLGIMQKKILDKAQKLKSNIIIASGTLESLLYSDMPNRSDVIDITNSYLSGASGIMLTSETGASKTPFVAIDFLIKVISYLISINDN